MTAHGDKTPWQRTNILVTDTLLSQHRVRPSSIKLKSFHLTSATAVRGSPRSGATSLCMMALDGPNFRMWLKRQSSCTSAVADHLLSLRVDLSSRTPSQGDGIKGAKMKTVPSGTRALQGWKPRTSLQLKMAPKILNGPTWEASHHHQRVAPKQHWVGEAHSWVDAEAVALLADASILDPNSAACTIRPPHTRRACILMQAETERVAMRQSTRFFHCLFSKLFYCEITIWKNWIFWTSWKKPFKFSPGLLLWWSLLVLEKLSFSPAHRKVVWSSLSCYFSLFTFVKMASQKLSPWKNKQTSFISFWFSFDIFWKKKALFIYFQVSSYFFTFLCVCVCFFFFLCFVFLVFSSFVSFSNEKIHLKK